MEAREVIGSYAARRGVEQVTLRVFHAARLTPSLEDLVQMTYEYLLHYDPTKIVGAAERQELDNIVAAILSNQRREATGQWRKLVVEFTERNNGEKAITTTTDE